MSTASRRCRCFCLTHPFLRILFPFSFFPLFTLPQAIFFPQNPYFWDLRSAFSSREKATCRGWVLGTVLDGVAPQEKKENPFFLARKKVRFVPSEFQEPLREYQDHRKAGLSLRGVAFMTVLALLTVLRALESTSPCCCLSCKIQHNEGAVALLRVLAVLFVVLAFRYLEGSKGHTWKGHRENTLKDPEKTLQKP